MILFFKIFEVMGNQVMSEMGYNDGAREDCYIQSFELETLK